MSNELTVADIIKGAFEGKISVTESAFENVIGEKLLAALEEKRAEIASTLIDEEPEFVEEDSEDEDLEEETEDEDDDDLEEASQSQWRVDIAGMGRATVTAHNEKQAKDRALAKLKIKKDVRSDYMMGVGAKKVKVTKLSEEVEE